MSKKDKKKMRAMEKYDEELGYKTGNKSMAPPEVIKQGGNDGAFGQFMLSQLNALGQMAKVDKPLNKDKNAAKDKGGKKGNVKVVDAAGRNEDDDDDNPLMQKVLDNQPFTDDQIKEAFFTFDMNGNGYIGVAEIRFVLDALGEDVTEEEIDEMVRMLDVDGDGQVNFKEFYKMASGQSLAPIGVALPPPKDINIVQRLGLSADEINRSEDESASSSEGSGESDSDGSEDMGKGKGKKAPA